MTRRPLPLCLPALFALLSACGGRASSADTDADLPGDIPSVEEVPSVDTPSTDTPSVDTPSGDVPEDLQRLELRRFDDSNDVEGSLLRCEYSERIKVYFRSGELSTGSCEELGGGVSRARETKKILDADMERILEAYAELRVVSGGQCESSADRLSLAVLSEDDPADVPVLDAEHSGCPLPGLEGKAFVQGLDQLYRVLASL
ncbi:MAG TPA: hypothetical protein VJU61_11875 [Polyangiaceae bacterium]|nr:hypothetical protein [Polyangiaceae bacterium]